MPFGSKELVIVVAVGLWWRKAAVVFKWVQNEKVRQTQLMSRSMFQASEYLKRYVRVRLHGLCALGRRHEQIWQHFGRHWGASDCLVLVTTNVLILRRRHTAH